MSEDESSADVLASAPDPSKLPAELQHAPEYLTASSRELYEHICSTGTYDASARILVAQFLYQRDVAANAREHIEKEGRVFKDRWNQPRQYPYVEIERQATREMGRLFHLLGWDLAPADLQRDLFPV